MVTAIADRLAVLVGAALVIYGVAMFSLPLGVIFAGLFLLAGALWRTRS